MSFVRKDSTWIICIVILILSLVAGIFITGIAVAYDAPPKDQGHTGPDPYDDDETKCPENDCAKRGSPVYVETGSYIYSHQDLIVPGRGIPLNVTRRYDSQDLYDGPFGFGWKFRSELRLIETTDGVDEYANIRRDDGIRLNFTRNTDGSYTAPQGRRDYLAKNSDSTFTWCEAGCTTCGGSCYNFDTSGYLSNIKDTNINQMSFSYDSTGKLIQITDASGRKLTISYGSNNKIALIKDPANRPFTYGYDTGGNLTSYTDPMGNTMTYAYDAEHNLTGITDAKGDTVSTITYDSEDRVNSYTEYGETWTYTYDPENNTTHKDDSAGNRWTIVLNDTGQSVSNKDPLGNTTTSTYDDNFNITAVTDARGFTRSYTYDSNDNKLTETDAVGNTTTYTYDLAFNKLSTITDPLGHVTKGHYDSNGNLTGSTDPLGNLTSYTYDANGNRTSVTDSLGNTTSYTYDTDGNLLNFTDALGNITIYTYDSSGNKLTKTDDLGNTTTFIYDSSNRVTSVTDAVGNTASANYDAKGNLISVIDIAGNKTTYTYDSENQLITKTDRLGSITHFTYDARGNLTSIKDANGNTTVITYNILNQRITETDALGNSVRYIYDGNGHLLTTTDANGNTMAGTYDALNRLLKITYPDGNFEAFSYDAVGNRITKTDQNGATIQYTYDALRRRTMISYPDSTKVQIAYDSNGNLMTVSNSDVTYSFTYDSLNRLTQMTNATIGKSVSYSYIGSDLKSSMTDPEGGVTNYIYDTKKRLTTLINSQGETTTYTYNNLSRITRKELANGLFTTYTYDDAGRLLSTLNKASDESVISSYSYTFDNTNNITSKSTFAGIHNYSYDKINQLLQATHPTFAVETYTYGPVHNRLTSSDHSNWTYDSSNRLTGYNGTSFTYDANGNMLSKIEASVTTTYQYDYENRLKRIDHPDGTYSEFAYDPFGNRIKKSVNGTTTWFVYDLTNGVSNILAGYDNSGSLISKYTHGPNVDDPISVQTNGKSYFYFKDGLLGSVTSLTDNAGAIINTYKYDSYGNFLQYLEGVNNNYTFTGREWDDEGRLYYYRARYYDPAIGRFLTSDPSKDGINFYTYVSNNPTSAIDPLGLAARYVGIEAGVIGGGGITYVECCDWKDNLVEMYFWKKCIGAMASGGVAVGFLPSAFSYDCDYTKYEGWFFEVSGGIPIPWAPVVSVGGDLDIGGWPFGEHGTNEAGLAVGVGAPGKGAFCKYKLLGMRPDVTRKGCRNGVPCNPTIPRPFWWFGKRS